MKSYTLLAQEHVRKLQTYLRILVYEGLYHFNLIVPGKFLPFPYFLCPECSFLGIFFNEIDGQCMLWAEIEPGLWDSADLFWLGECYRGSFLGARKQSPPTWKVENPFITIQWPFLLWVLAICAEAHWVPLTASPRPLCLLTITT